MVDWPGLLKWSLKYQDGSYVNKDLKPMDEETKKWLEEALQAYSVDHVKKMKEILAALPNSENPLLLLEDLSDLIENLDAGLVLCQLNGMPLIIDLILNHKDPKVRFSATMIFQSVVQNSDENQKYALQSGGFKLVDRLLNEETLMNKEAAFSALSAMIRGEYLDIKREFIDIDGLELLNKLLIDYKHSEKIRSKILMLLKDLVYYDEFLHQKTVLQTELQEKCEKYRGIVKMKLMDMNFCQLFEEIISEYTKSNIELRNSAATILSDLVQKYHEGFKEKKAHLLDIVKTHLKDILMENSKNEGVYENEIEIFKELTRSLQAL